MALQKLRTFTASDELAERVTSRKMKVELVQWIVVGIHESKSTAIGTNGTRAEHGTRNVKIVLSASQMVPCLR